MAPDMPSDRLRFARMATMTIILMPARPMGITGRVTLLAASSSAQAPGITAIMDRDITGVLTMAPAGATTAVTAITAIEAGDMDITEATVADITGMGSMGEASMAVAAITVAADSMVTGN